jgi:hypothetical protein
MPLLPLLDFSNSAPAPGKYFFCRTKILSKKAMLSKPACLVESFFLSSSVRMLVFKLRRQIWFSFRIKLIFVQEEAGSSVKGSNYA